MVILRLMEEK